MALGTRRRNRANGVVTSVGLDGVDVEVGQTFGNCPQYIQTRDHRFVREPGSRRGSLAPEEDTNANVERLSSLDMAAKDLIKRSDTFWVASASSDGRGDASGAGPGPESSAAAAGADVSHRGGQPGFVKVDGDVLTIPDFTGNFHFNTLGNFVVNPRGGLLFVDFETGDVLMLTGDVDILFEGPDVETFSGAERAWRFRVKGGVRMRDALPLRWTLRETGKKPRR